MQHILFILKLRPAVAFSLSSISYCEDICSLDGNVEGIALNTIVDCYARMKESGKDSSAHLSFVFSEGDVSIPVFSNPEIVFIDILKETGSG